MFETVHERERHLIAASKVLRSKISGCKGGRRFLIRPAVECNLAPEGIVYTRFANIGRVTCLQRSGRYYDTQTLSSV